MHKFLIIAAAALALTACSTTEKGAVIGGVGGAVIGAAATGSVVGTAVGAGIGTVVGAAAGNVLGRVDGSNNICIYERRDGSRYRDTCPAY